MSRGARPDPEAPPSTSDQLEAMVPTQKLDDRSKSRQVDMLGKDSPLDEMIAPIEGFFLVSIVILPLLAATVALVVMSRRGWNHPSPDEISLFVFFVMAWCWTDLRLIFAAMVGVLPSTYLREWRKTGDGLASLNISEMKVGRFTLIATIQMLVLSSLGVLGAWLFFKFPSVWSAGVLSAGATWIMWSALRASYGKIRDLVVEKSSFSGE